MEKKGSCFIKCCISERDNLIFVDRLPLEQDIIYNSRDYSAITASNSFFFSIARILKKLKENDEKIGNFELYQNTDSGNLNISIDKGEAIIECVNNEYLSIKSASLKMLHKITEILL